MLDIYILTWRHDNVDRLNWRSSKTSSEAWVSGHKCFWIPSYCIFPKPEINRKKGITLGENRFTSHTKCAVRVNNKIRRKCRKFMIGLAATITTNKMNNLGEKIFLQTGNWEENLKNGSRRQCGRNDKTWSKKCRSLATKRNGNLSRPHYFTYLLSLWHFDASRLCFIAGSKAAKLCRP